VTRRIVAIALIFIFASGAWLALGGVTHYRTSTAYRGLRGEVGALWGTRHSQTAPRLVYPEAAESEEKQQADRVALAPERSDVAVDLSLDQRKKGLLWYSTYRVSFDGAYTFRNDLKASKKFLVEFEFPARDAIYDDFRFELDGREVDVEPGSRGVVSSPVVLSPGEAVDLRVSYESRGLDEWKYAFGHGVSHVKNFRLEMTTDFDDIDFPRNTISPGTKERTAEGWRLVWKHDNLMSGFALGMTMPQKPNPGYLAGRMSLFAPISLLFFFTIVFMLSVMRGYRIHPMNYFFLAAAFFAFNLLFSYLVDHIDVNLAFLISAAASVGLVVSYLRLVVGPRFALVEAGGAQLVYLVLFSYAHFFQGYTGLAITVASVITLFVLMQATGRIDWDERFSGDGP